MRLRDHDTVGPAAREALANLCPSLTRPALDRAAAARTPRPRPRPAGPVLSVYRSGDRVGAWAALRAVGPLDAAGRRSAERLATETMLRVRTHLEVLVADLVGAGWPVDLRAALTGPATGLEERICDLETLTGAPLPVALTAFWRVVGSVRLVPDDVDAVPDNLAILDPLEIVDPDTAWWSVEEWQEDTDGLHPEIAGPLGLALSADHLHKADISGGPPYSVRLPDPGPDPLFREDTRRLPFTDYLRHALAGYGFARAEHADPEARRWLDALPARLVDF